MRKSLIVSDGTKIYYEKTETMHGKPMLLLHGLGGDLRAWDVERKALEQQGFSVITIDLRGHGRSSRPKQREAYALGNFAKDVHQILLAEQLKKVIVAGHCFGGIVAQYLTVE